jgi:hypothetical protein
LASVASKFANLMAFVTKQPRLAAAGTACDV